MSSDPLSRPSGANFSRCLRYRYSLWRTWDPLGSKVMMIGLNPSTADARKDDPTIRRCIGFARSWGHGGLIMTNLFAFRATYPSELKQAPDPVGARNDEWIRRLARRADRMVAVWGNDGAWLDRAERIQRRFGPRLQIIRLNQSGSPAHPLYLPARLAPKAWPGQNQSEAC